MYCERNQKSIKEIQQVAKRKEGTNIDYGKYKSEISMYEVLVIIEGFKGRKFEQLLFDDVKLIEADYVEHLISSQITNQVVVTNTIIEENRISFIWSIPIPLRIDNPSKEKIEASIRTHLENMELIVTEIHLIEVKEVPKYQNELVKNVNLLRKISKILGLDMELRLYQSEKKGGM